MLKLPKSALKELFASTSVYGFGSLLNTLIPFLLLPVLTRYLSIEAYGLVSIFTISVVVVANFVGLNLSAAIQRFYIDGSKEEFREYVGTAFYLIIFSLLVCLSVSLLFRESLSELILFPAAWVPLIVLASFFHSLVSIILVVFRMDNNAFSYVKLRLLQSVLNLGASILFVVVLLGGWKGRILGIIVSLVFCGILSMLLMIKTGKMNLSFKSKYVLPMLGFSSPLVLHRLSSLVITSSDRFFILHIIGVATVGIYSVGYALGQIIQMIQEAFSLAWVPYFFKKMNEKTLESRILVVKIIYLHHLAIVLLTLLLILLAPFIVDIFVGESFSSALEIVKWVASAYAVYGMYRMILPILNFTKKTKFAPMASGIAAIFGLVFNYLLISRNGIVGAAQAALLSFLVLYLLTFYFAWKSCDLPWLFWLKNDK